MDSEAFSLQRVKLRAFDLSDRTVRRGRASAVRRVERWRQRAFMIVQCSVTAGFAWFIAGLLLGHEVPYFAAVAAILVLGMAYGQRLRRGVDVAIGVTLGVALGDLWFVLFGAGVWQVVLVCAIAMSVGDPGWSRPTDNDPGRRQVHRSAGHGAQSCVRIRTLG